MATDISDMQTTIEAQNKKYEEMLTTGSALNPIVAAAIADMRLRQQAIKEEQDVLLHSNEIKAEKFFLDVSGDEFVRQVRYSSLQDKRFIENFNKMVAELPLVKRNEIPFAVRTNKMNLIIDGTHTTIFDNDEEANIMRIAHGRLPIGYTNVIDEFPVLDSGRFWGTSKVTYLSYSILAVNFSLNGSGMQTIPLTSSITHVAPLPEGIALDPKCRFSYSAEITDRFFCFGYVHSGYSFGGYRGEELRLHHAKKCGPEDCSSWLAKITNCPILFSTADQLCAYRTTLKTGFVPPVWITSKEGEDMPSRYEAIPTIDAVQPGDLFFYRSFKRTENLNTNLGTSGHTGIVLNKSTDKVTILAFSRDMPVSEGFGIQEFPLSPVVVGDSVKVPLFQRVKL